MEIDSLLFGCEYMTQGKRTLTEGPKVTWEIRRSDGDPTRSEIQEYHLVVESRLSIVADDTRVHTCEGTSVDGSTA